MTPTTELLLSTILGRLDFAALKRKEGEEFTPLGVTPDWLEEYFGAAENPADESFFLADFLEHRAEPFWNAVGEDESLRSGFWEETSDAGESRHFEAIAMRLGDSRILVLESADDRHDREQMFVQQWHVDTLERRRLAKEIEKKEILLDCIVHDLSHPLSTIMMNLQHLGKKIGDEKLNRSVERALGQAQRQRSLIRSIAEVFRSDLSAFDAIDVRPEDAPRIGPVASEILEAYRENAEEKGVELAFESDLPDGDGELRVFGEKEHLERVFENLLVNALRHSPENSRVLVTLEKEPERGTVLARVEDQGPGVDPAIAATLFKPFVQGAGNVGHSGLGLYFCKVMIQLWGGEIGYRPGEEKGACFWFRLPLVQTPPSE